MAKVIDLFFDVMVKSPIHCCLSAIYFGRK